MSTEAEAPETEAAAPEPEVPGPETKAPAASTRQSPIPGLLALMAMMLLLTTAANDAITRWQSSSRQHQICAILIDCGAKRAKCGHLVIGDAHIDVQGRHIILYEGRQIEIITYPEDGDVRELAKELKDEAKTPHKPKPKPDSDTEPARLEPEQRASEPPPRGRLVVIK